MNDFNKADAKVKAEIAKRARELYPHYDEMWSENDIGYEGGAYTQEDARKEARESLQAGKFVEEWKAERQANRRVLRTVYLSPAEDEKLRVMAFRCGISKNDLIVEMIERGLARLDKQ